VNPDNGARIRFWHISTAPTASGNVGYRMQTGKLMLVLSLIGFDPKLSFPTFRILSTLGATGRAHVIVRAQAAYG
jgi:hypothetical protein